MKAVEHLKAAKARIDTPEKWTKGTRARDALGFPVDPQSPRAWCFCAIGAIAAVTPYVEARGTARGYLHLALAYDYRESIPEEYNDTRRSHAVIMRWFDRAIKIAERAGK
jgi:hypothetical protein